MPLYTDLNNPNAPPNNIDTDWNYAGSTFEQIITATHGQAYSLCDGDFGAQLSAIGDDLVSRVDHPRIYLASRPLTNTIKVSFLGRDLPGGPQSKGGLWSYDYNLNAVVFYDVDFAIDAGDADEVQVTYTPDDGKTQPRALN
jgi:hypothetical protein